MLISRKDAKKSGVKYYFTGKPCKYGHISNRRTSDAVCVECALIATRLYKQRNRQKIREYARNWRLLHLDRFKNYNNACRKEKQKLYYQKHRSRLLLQQRTYNKNKKQSDPMFKMAANLRSLISNVLRNKGFSKKSKTSQILGCSFDEFKIHIENQFTDGMNWNNYGKWEYDHIFPVSKADDEIHMIQLNHYTNLQPMWKIDNIRKGNKISKR